MLILMLTYEYNWQRKEDGYLRWRQSIAEVREENFLIIFIAEKLLEKGYTKLVKRLP